MKIIISIILVGLIGTFVAGNDLNPELIKKNSEVKIIHLVDFGARVLLTKIDGKYISLEKIEYRAICRNGNVKIETHYHTTKNTVIKRESPGKTSEYLSLWKDLIITGLTELEALRMDDAIDPFEFVDSWRIDQDTHFLHFNVGNRKINFKLYDIESFRDKRFKKVLNRVMAFINKQYSSQHQVVNGVKDENQ